MESLSWIGQCKKLSGTLKNINLKHLLFTIFSDRINDLVILTCEGNHATFNIRKYEANDLRFYFFLIFQTSFFFLFILLLLLFLLFIKWGGWGARVGNRILR